jgi:hypothetical protein
MAASIAKIRIVTIAKDTEFMIDTSTETILHVQDRDDDTICIYIISYIRKGE